MNVVQPIEFDTVAEDDKAIMAGAKYAMGFVPNDCVTMAKKPGLLKAASQLYATVFQKGAIEPRLKHLALVVAYHAVGDRFGMQMAITFCKEAGIPQEAIENAVRETESSYFSTFDMRIFNAARDMATGQNVIRLPRRGMASLALSESETVELAAVLAFQAFVSRWNDLLDTELQTADNDEPVHMAAIEKLMA